MVGDGHITTIPTRGRQWVSIETPVGLSMGRKHNWVKNTLANEKHVPKVVPKVMAAAIKNGVINEDNALALFIDLDRLRNKVASLHAAFPDKSKGGPFKITHAYAVKANPLSGVLQEMK